MTPEDREFFRSLRDGMNPPEIKSRRPAKVNYPTEDEPPRYKIRAVVLGLTLIFCLASAIILATLRNPLAEVQDLRLGTRYNAQPLTSLAGDASGRALWLGSLGGGLKVFDPAHHFFRGDVTVASTKGMLLSDFVAGADMGTNSPLGAIVATDGKDGPGGLQMAEAGIQPKFWKEPIVDLSSFPGLTDSNATAVAGSADKRYLVFGTKGLGLGVYRAQTHSWQSILTTANGLTSDNIEDLVVADGANDSEVIWVATDHGLCAGPLNQQGQLAIRWKWQQQQGLAGDDIIRLHLDSGFVWYLTRNGGLGRLELDQTGGPHGDGAHRLFVSERRLPGLNDAQFRWAIGSPAGPTTWFTAQIGVSNFIGRYREMPHDTFGIPMPDALQKAALNSVDTDADSGSAFLVGSSDGAWFFKDAPGPALGEITGGSAGLAGQNVLEVAQSTNRSTAKLLAGDVPWLATVGNIKAPLPWTWTKLVGPGRFPQLASIGDISCVAGNSNRVWFGTRGNGIGLWSRDGMEVTQEFSSRASEVTNRLRNDGSLDLAFHQGALVQVTGDHAVDFFRPGEQRFEMIPASAAPFGTNGIVSVAASGSSLAAANGSAIGLYDESLFKWTRLPDLSGVTRLEFTGSYLWGLTSGGNLNRLDVSVENSTWQAMCAGARGVAVSGQNLYVLRHLSGSPDSLAIFQPGATQLKVVLELGSLPPGAQDWQQGSAVGEDLYLLSSKRMLCNYNLAARKWKQIPVPDEIHLPLKQAISTESDWFLLDSTGTLHCFRYQNGDFLVGLESAVDRIDALGQDALALRSQSTDNDLLVLQGDDQNPASVVVGRPFEGDLAKITDATELNGKLVAAEGSHIGIYDWGSHSWVKRFSVNGTVVRFHGNTRTLWVEMSGADGSLEELTEDGLHPVAFPAEAFPLQKISAAQDGLYVLDHKGRVYFAANEAPLHPVLSVAASTLPESPSRAPWAMLDDAPATATGSQLHVFRASGDVPSWQTLNLGSEVKRLAGGGGHRLLALTAAGLQDVRVNRDGDLASTLVNLPPAADVHSLAVGESGALIVGRTTAETGMGAWFLNAASQLNTVIGAPAPRSEATRAVAELPNHSGFFRVDASGASAFYTFGDHSWRAVSGPKIDAVYHLGDNTYGFSQADNSLCGLADSGWSQINSASDRITNVQAFPRGLLLWRNDGQLGVFTGTIHWPRAPALDAKPAAALGDIKDVSELDGSLILLGTSGHVEGYDWDAQRWLRSDLKDTQQFLGRGAKLYLYREGLGAGQLAGPLRVENGALTAATVDSRAPLDAVTCAGEDIFALAHDGVIEHLGDRGLEAFWGRARTGQAGSSHGDALTAIHAGDEIWILLQGQENSFVLLRLDPRTLKSASQPLPSGKVENIFYVNNVGLCAIQSVANGRRILNISTRQMAAPAITNAGAFGFEDGIFKLATESGVWEARDGRWTNPAVSVAAIVSTNTAHAATNATANSATNAGTQVAALAPAFTNSLQQVMNLFVEDPNGAWADARQPGHRLSLIVRKSRVLPGSAGGLLHERVNDIASFNGSLVAATDGGIVEFQAGAAGAVDRVFVPGEGASQAGVTALTEGNVLMARLLDNTWLARGNKEWQKADAGPSPSDLLAYDLQRGNRRLDNWRWIQRGEFKRRTRAGEMRDALLGTRGFDFEFAKAAEINDDGRLWIHTDAGTSVFDPEAAERSPEDLLPAWAAPGDLARGFVVPLPDGTRLLSPTSNPTGAGDDKLWTRTANGWSLASERQRQKLRSFAAAPFLDSDSFRWDRAESQGRETVIYKSGAAPVRSGFSPTEGRFGWDVCHDAGQAQGQPWVLTEAGLFRVSQGQMELSTQAALPAPPDQLKFAEITGGMPGGLLRGEDLLEVCDGAWRPASEPELSSLAALVREYRAVTDTWKIRRDGGLLRALPQDHQKFGPAQVLPNGRWNFESVNDLATLRDECFLATEAGMGRWQNKSWSAWWPETGKAAAVGVPDRIPIAEADSRRVEFKDNRWNVSGFQGPLVAPVVIEDMPHFRATRQASGGAALALHLESGDVKELAPHGNRFPFDEIRAAALAGGVPFIVTSMGNWIVAHNGGLTPQPGIGQPTNDSVEFTRVAEEPDSWTLCMRTGGATYRWMQGWRAVPSDEAALIETLRAQRLAYTKTWQVETLPGAGFDFRLRLNNAANNPYRHVPYVADDGRFGFDAPLSVACDGEALYLGTKAGLQLLDEQGKLLRLWCQENNHGQILDGIGPGPVDQLAFDESKKLQLRASGKYSQIEGEGAPAAPSSRGQFVAAVSLRHADPAGWRLIYSAEEQQRLQMQWKGQPVFLIATDDGGVRFAHNVVYSAADVGGRLAFGTAGGLLMVDPAARAPGESAQLLCSGFQTDADSPPPAIDWMRKKNETVVIAKLREHGAFLVSVSEPKILSQVSVSELSEASEQNVAADDLLLWRHPDIGRVEVLYSPGKVFPSRLKPEIKGGTFTFADLNVPRSAEASSIRATTWGLFWLTRAGIFQMAPGSDQIVALQQTSSDQTAMLNQLNDMRSDPGNGMLFARGPESVVQFDSSSGRWIPAPAGSDPFKDKRLVNCSPMLDWRQGNQEVQVSMKASDQPGMGVFSDGKPAVDQVHEIAFMSESNREYLLLATEGGVVLREAKTFDFVKRSAAAFSPHQAAAPVEAVVSVPQEGHWRQGARTPAGKMFERISDQWSENTDMSEVFERAYNRVEDSSRWNWSRYPTGLACRLQNVNGQAVSLGNAVNGSYSPAFSRGKISIDDIRNAIVEGAEVLAITPVGVARYHLLPQDQQAKLDDIDLWAQPASGGALAPVLTNLLGIVRDHGLQVWNGQDVYMNLQNSQWSLSAIQYGAWQRERQIGIRWKATLNPSRPDELKVDYRGGGGSSWFVPARGPDILNAVVSVDGLWVLTSDGLYFADEQKLKQSVWQIAGLGRIKELIEYSSYRSP